MITQPSRRGAPKGASQHLGGALREQRGVSGTGVCPAGVLGGVLAATLTTFVIAVVRQVLQRPLGADQVAQAREVLVWAVYGAM